MAEPASTTSLSLAGLMITLFGAALGPYAAIVCAALAGAMYSVSRADTGGARRGVLTLLQIVVTAIVLTGRGSMGHRSSRPDCTPPISWPSWHS